MAFAAPAPLRVQLLPSTSSSSSICAKNQKARTRRANPTIIAATKIDDKTEVEKYFNGTGFSRWSRIYSDTADVNRVQREIRRGHAETVRTVLRWLADEPLSSSILDAGCGVGSLSHPLSSRGHSVHGVDISAAMVAEAERRAPSGSSATFAVGDVDSAAESNPSTVVACLDVLIHYPESDALATLRRLGDSAERRLIVSFAPSTPYLDVLKWVGSIFPGPSKATRAYLHKEEAIRKTLKDAGFSVTRSRLCETPFYFSQVLDCARV